MNVDFVYLCGYRALKGGIEKYNSDFIRSINEVGHKCKVIERMPGGLPTKITFALNFLIPLFSYKPRHVVCGHLYFSPLVMFAASIFRFEYSINLYGIEAIKINNYLQKLALKSAKKIIVISNYTKGLVLNQFPEFEDKLFMLKSCVDEDMYRPLSNRDAVKDKYGLARSRVILTLSRLSTREEKGQERVIKAFSEVLKKIPDAIYVLAGPGSDVRVDELLKDPRLAAKVKRLGAVSEAEKNEIYNLADVFVLPSKYEGFGIVFIEAMASGCWVVASDGYGCREGLANGDLGDLVDPDDISEIASTITDALKENAHNSMEKRQNLRAKTLEIYGYNTWKKCVEDFTRDVVG